MTTPCIGCQPDADHGVNYRERRNATPMTTSGLRQAWAPACPTAELVTVKLYGNGRITIRKGTEAAWAALSDVLGRHNYKTRAADTGAYNCRQITGGTGFSLHAYGIAADLNWQSNPYGPTLVTDMPREMVDEIIAIRTNRGSQVFRWGGDYKTNKDAMHFEIVCTPGDLATGIRSDAPTPPTEDDMTPEQAATLNQLASDVAEIKRQVTKSEDDSAKGGRTLRHIAASILRK